MKTGIDKVIKRAYNTTVVKKVIGVSRNKNESEVCDMNNKKMNVTVTKVNMFCKSYAQRTYGSTSSCPQ